MYRVLWQLKFGLPVLMGVGIWASLSGIASAEVSEQVTQSQDFVEPQAFQVESQAATPPETPLESEQSSLPMSQLTPVVELAPSTAASTPALSQLTSVSQLSDVQPTDWAYQALQSLVERYGCIVGYPDGTYKGQRALTRFEFAAGLNSCLDRISELLAASTADLATKEDLASLQRLQEEFAAELATLRGRVDVLDGRVAQLEANQFSTTTKLSGDGYLVAADVFGDEIGDDNNTVAFYRSRLFFDTSFSGQDRLRAILQAGNNQVFSQPGNEIRFAGQLGSSGNFNIDTLSYVFPVTDRAQVGVFANGAGLDTLVFGNTITPFDVGAARGAISLFAQRPPIYRTSPTAAGLSVNLQLAKPLSLQVGYGSGEPGDPSLGSGLFNGNYGIIGQLTGRNLFGLLDLGLTYVNAYTGISSTSAGITAGLRTNTGSLLAAVDADRPVVGNSYGATANFKITPGFQIGGWANYSAVRAISLGDANVWNYGATLAFPDLLGKGNLGGIVVGIQPRLTGSSTALGAALGRRSDRDVGLHLEAFYRIAVNDNIDITPGFFWLTAPNHDHDNADAIVGELRTTYRF